MSRVDSTASIVASGTQLYSDVESWARTSTRVPSSVPSNDPLSVNESWSPPDPNRSTAIPNDEHASNRGSPSTNNTSRIVIPIISLIGAAMLVLILMMFMRLRRRKRALAAHRRKHSWVNAHKYRWDTKPQPNDLEQANGTYQPEAPPAYEPPTPPPPVRAQTHQRQTSLI